jgi:hypothetical protein
VYFVLSSVLFDGSYFLDFFDVSKFVIFPFFQFFSFLYFFVIDPGLAQILYVVCFLSKNSTFAHFYNMLIRAVHKVVNYKKTPKKRFVKNCKNFSKFDIFLSFFHVFHPFPRRLSHIKNNTCLDKGRAKETKSFHDTLLTKGS